jgi:hypothetical protein
MITICFPPGCYGNYLARSIYTYTNLRVGKYNNFKFSTNGGSHVNSENIKTKIQCVHLEKLLTTDKNNYVITILPCVDHRLDYYNNQIKKNNNTLIEYIAPQISPEEMNQTLLNGWGYSDGFTDSTPIWILREYFSLWIVNCFENAYSINQYKNINSMIVINTQDIFVNFTHTLNIICQAVNLKIDIAELEIEKNHMRFLSLQKYHNSQIKCQQWVTDIIDGVDSSSPCQTIFDEAYVQFLLRGLGFELRCDGLNKFPSTSLAIKELVYEK